MSTPTPRTRTVPVALPDEIFLARPWRSEAPARELRTLWLIERVGDRRVGFDKAAELAGLPQADFIRLLGERGVTIFDLDDDELAEELGGK